MRPEQSQLRCGVNLCLGIVGSLSVLSALASNHQEQQADPATTSEAQVEIKAIRDPAIMPYKRAYEMLTRINALALNDVRLSIRAVSEKTKMAIPDLQIRLEGNSKSHAVPVSEFGEVTVPLDQQAYEEGAEFITNQKKETMGVHLTLFPVLPQPGFPYSAITHSIDSARKALREIIPWYYRIFISNPSGVAICYEEQHHTVILKGKDEQSVAADQKIPGYKSKDRYCAKLPLGDVENKMVLPEPGWQATYF